MSIQMLIQQWKANTNNDFLILKLRELRKSNKFLLLENNCATHNNCMIGDGNVGYDEWFDMLDFETPEELQEYKDWLGYSSSTDEEESDEYD